THSPLPFRAHLREEVGPAVGGTAAIGAVCNDDVLVWQFHFWIRILDGGIVPLLYFAEENVSERLGRKSQRLRYAWHVVCGNGSAENSREMQNVGPLLGAIILQL